MSLTILRHGKLIACSQSPAANNAVVQSVAFTHPISGNNQNKAENPPTPQPTVAPPKMVWELLTALESEKDYGMMRTTAHYFTEFKQVPFEQLKIDDIDNMASPFKDFLRKKAPYQKNSIRSFCTYLQRLVAHAKRLGWVTAKPEVADFWKDMIVALPTNGSRGIPRFAIRIGKAAEFTDADLDRWEQDFLENGGSYKNAKRLKASFRRSLADSGLSERLPNINCDKQRHGHYSDPFHLLPAKWKADIELVIHTKLAKKVIPGRGKRIRPITGQNVKNGFIRYCGYLIKVAGREDLYDAPLPHLFTKNLVIGYINFCLTTRGLKGDSVRNLLRVLHATLKCHSAYNAQDFSWFASVVSEIELEPSSAKFKRKMEKYVDFGLLEQIRYMLLAKRKEAAKLGNQAVAWLIHDALLISWFITLVWRQRNVRECRLGHNLFRAALLPMTQITIPAWVREKLKSNAQEQFWQFYFAEDETKAGRIVHSILPHTLVSLLEEYLSKWRPLLVRNTDPGTLFLNREGGPLTSEELRDLVSNLTLKYARRRVNPHMFRDIFAYWWLSQYAEDINTVSKMLWHKNIQTTINIYGWKFDESAALCRVETIREFQGQQQLAQRPPQPKPETKASNAKDSGFPPEWHKKQAA